MGLLNWLIYWQHSVIYWIKNIILKKLITWPERLKHVKEDSLVGQNHMSFIPANLALSYSMDDEELKTYMQIIIKAMVIGKKDKSSSVLCWDNKTQLSPIDAVCFKEYNGDANKTYYWFIFLISDRGFWSFYNWKYYMAR